MFTPGGEIAGCGVRRVDLSTVMCAGRASGARQRRPSHLVRRLAGWGLLLAGLGAAGNAAPTAVHRADTLSASAPPRALPWLLVVRHPPLRTSVGPRARCDGHPGARRPRPTSPSSAERPAAFSEAPLRGLAAPLVCRRASPLRRRSAGVALFGELRRDVAHRARSRLVGPIQSLRAAPGVDSQIPDPLDLDHDPHLGAFRGARIVGPLRRWSRLSWVRCRGRCSSGSDARGP